jgi:hypothetical protein
MILGGKFNVLNRLKKSIKKDVVTLAIVGEAAIAINKR